MKNRIFAILMCLVLMLGVLPATAMAVEIVDSGKCGENLTWTITDDGTLTISGKGDMKDYEAYKWINDPHPEGWDEHFVDTIVIENGVTRVGNYAFRNFEHLTEVRISDSVTSIGDYAFVNCYKLRGIKIPAGVTEMGENVFQDCSGLDRIIVDDENQHYSSDERRVLFNKDKTVLIDAPIDLKGSYTIPESVIEIGEEAFYEFPGLTDLTEIIIPESVREIGEYAFQDCSSLTEVTIPKGVTKIGDCAFVCCRKLSKVTIPDTVRDIGVQAFTSCDNLTEIIVDENNPNYSSGNGALLDKEKRTLIEVPAGIREYKVPESVTVIGKIAFINCHALEEVRFEGDSPKFEGSEHNLIFHKDGLTIRYPKNEPGWNETIENCQTCDYDTVTWKPYTPISTLGWICIGVAGVIVLGGVGFGTYKLIKKRKSVNAENSDN